ncbi:MAG: hypothetical protein ACYCYO_01870 [Bacilli bacterium]
MHTKQTVKYLCEHHLASGRKRYFKQEIITDSNWRELDSLRWSAPRPITQRTFRRAMDAGYPVEIKYLKAQPAQIVEFPLERALKRAEFNGPGVVKLLRRLHG